MKGKVAHAFSCRATCVFHQTAIDCHAVTYQMFSNRFGAGDIIQLALHPCISIKFVKGDLRNHHSTLNKLF